MLGRKTASPPWISNDLKKLIRRKNRMYKVKKKSSDKSHTDKYKDLRKEVQRKLRKEYWKYIHV